MAHRILVVCLGNICRSPATQAVLEARAAEAGLDLQIDSAGLGDWHLGQPPHPPMIDAARARGYDLSPQRARQVSAREFVRFDLILAADPSVLDSLERMRPTGNATPVRLLAPYADSALTEVPDPYYTGDYAGALALVERACDGLIAQLQ